MYSMFIVILVFAVAAPAVGGAPRSGQKSESQKSKVKGRSRTLDFGPSDLRLERSEGLAVTLE